MTSPMISVKVHLSAELWAAVDRRAKDLRVTRTSYIIRTLERSIRSDAEWSPAFVEELRAARHEPADHRLLAEMRDAIRANRKRGEPPATR